MDSLATPETPSTRPQTSSFDLSPPNSQGPPAPISTLASSASAPNANGKRPLSTLESTHDPASPIQPAMLRTTNGAALERQTHQPSGYSWTQPEDAPGYAWRNKRAVEDAERAWATVLDKDKRVASESEL